MGSPEHDRLAQAFVLFSDEDAGSHRAAHAIFCDGDGCLEIPRAGPGMGGAGPLDVTIVRPPVE